MDEILENSNFDLQQCIDYFMNQLPVKYFIKIRQELDNDNSKIKIGYYDLGRTHKESNCIKRRKKNSNKEKNEEKIHVYEHSLYTSCLYI